MLLNRGLKPRDWIQILVTGRFRGGRFLTAPTQRHIFRAAACWLFGRDTLGNTRIFKVELHLDDTGRACEFIGRSCGRRGVETSLA